MTKAIGLSVSLAAAVLLVGCAGYHTTPPANYSEVARANERVIKLAFDQEGTLYPPSDVRTPPKQMDNRNAAFTLKSGAGFGEAYDDAPHVAAAAQKIAARAAASRGGRIIFLIKGFNNSYEEFDNEYAFLRQRIHDYEPSEDLTFVQVYWDALWKGPGTAPAPLAYWGDSMTYSNLAGMCGLRRVLRLLPRGTKATFLTHSRGAAVALAAVANPIYRGVNHCEEPALPDGSLADSFLVAFAPAIGDGHMRDKEGAVVRDMFANLDRMYVGFDEKDRATSKTYFGISVGPYRRGDTRLAARHAYFEEIQRGLGEDKLQREIFTQKEHAITAYMSPDQDLQTRCLLWAGKVIETDPQRCQVRR